MPILKLRWSILGPKDLSIQWRSLLSRPASFSMISSARRSPVKRLNPSQVRILLPLAALSCRRNSPEFYMKNVWVSGKSFTESKRKLSCLKTDAFPSCTLFSMWMTGQILHRLWIRSGLGALTPASRNQTLLASVKHFRGPFSSIYCSTQDDFSSRILQQVVTSLSENGQDYWAG